MPISTISPQNNTQQSLLTQSLSATGANLMSALNSAIQKSRDDAQVRFSQEQNLINEQQRNIANDRTERFNTQDRSEFLMKFGQSQERESLNNASKALELGGRANKLGFEEREMDKLEKNAATNADIQVSQVDQNRRAIESGVDKVSAAEQAKADSIEAKRQAEAKRAENDRIINDEDNFLEKGIGAIGNFFEPGSADNKELVKLREKQAAATANGNEVLATRFDTQASNLEREIDNKTKKQSVEGDRNFKRELIAEGNKGTTTSSVKPMTDSTKLAYTKALQEAEVEQANLDKNDPAYKALENSIASYKNALSGNTTGGVSNNPLSLFSGVGSASNTPPTTETSATTTPVTPPQAATETPSFNQRNQDELNIVKRISQMTNPVQMSRGGAIPGTDTDLSPSQVAREISEAAKTQVAATIGVDNKYIENLQKKKNPTPEDEEVLKTWNAVKQRLTNAYSEYKDGARDSINEKNDARQERSQLLKSLSE